jgi:alpha-glucoside transport system permease protein
MAVTAVEPNPFGVGPGVGGQRTLKRHLASLAFLAPAAIWLLAVVVYPLIATVRYSLFDETGTQFVGLRNYGSVFSTASILTTFKNNVVWVIVFPFFVTVLGLVFGVLTERIRWSTAFKTIIVMPIVFSTTASALVWRTIFDLDPHIGVVNAATETVDDWFNTPGSYPVDASAGQTVAGLASTGVHAAPGGNLVSNTTVRPGGRVLLGLTGISPATLQMLGAQSAVFPPRSAGAIEGLVWRDFSPSHPTKHGSVFPDEVGIPNMRVALVAAAGGAGMANATTDSHGRFTFSGVPAGAYRVVLPSSNFQSGFNGVFWLGTQSITPTSGLNQTAQSLLSVPLVDLAMIMAYLWIWAGFAMVVIGAGLAALNREVLEAARIDGATEWQTFRRVTMPMLAPVLAVVLVTMIINVLKVFDIILNMAPGSSQSDANTLALAIYNDGFTGGIHSGLASAIAVILFILVVPAMIWNLKRLRA